MFKPPPQLGRHRILGEIARSEHAYFYQARDDFGRLALLKVIPLADVSNQVRQRFIREAQAMAAVHGPNIPAMHSVAEENGVAYYARDFVEGETLEHKVKTERIRASEAVQALALIAEAVGRCHAQGLTHRNIHPSNVLIGTDGVPWLIGFSKTRAFGDHPPMTADCDLTALKGMLDWIFLAHNEPVPKSLAAAHSAQEVTEFARAFAGAHNEKGKRWWQFWR